MWAMIVKEFRQLRRDRRTLAMMIVLPIVLLVVFGYAASFDVDVDPARASSGPQAERLAAALPAPFEVHDVDPHAGRADAVEALRDGTVPVAFVTSRRRGHHPARRLRAVHRERRQGLARLARGSRPGGDLRRIEVLFNPELKTSAIMVPGLAAMILLFVGTVITSLGRRPGAPGGHARAARRDAASAGGRVPRQDRAVLRRRVADLAIVVLAGVWLFGVPFRGSVLVLALGRPAVPVRHARHRRADLERLAEPGAGDPARAHDAAAADAAVRA